MNAIAYAATQDMAISHFIVLIVILSGFIRVRAAVIDY